MRIASFGSVNIDIAVRIDRAPGPGETRFGEAVALGLGGKGANQAVAAARLGGDVTLIARVGDDSFGRDALERLCSFGLATDWVTRATSATGIALIQIDQSGQNAITVVSGANETVEAADFDKAVSAGGIPDILLLQLETPLAASVAAAREVRATGGVVIVDPAPPIVGRSLDELLTLADIALPNEHETFVLTGIDPINAETAKEAAMVLRNKGVRAPLIKCGARGAYLFLNDDLIAIPPRPVQVVDTVAAGDCFAGALAVAIAEGQDSVTAARFATAAAALSVTRHGAAEAVPTRSEVDRFLAT